MKPRARKESFRRGQCGARMSIVGRHHSKQWHLSNDNGRLVPVWLTPLESKRLRVPIDGEFVVRAASRSNGVLSLIVYMTIGWRERGTEASHDLRSLSKVGVLHCRDHRDIDRRARMARKKRRGWA